MGFPEILHNGGPSGTEIVSLGGLRSGTILGGGSQTDLGVMVGTVLGSGNETVTFEGTASNSVVSSGGWSSPTALELLRRRCVGVL